MAAAGEQIAVTRTRYWETAVSADRLLLRSAPLMLAAAITPRQLAVDGGGLPDANEELAVAQLQRRAKGARRCRAAPIMTPPSSVGRADDRQAASQRPALRCWNLLRPHGVFNSAGRSLSETRLPAAEAHGVADGSRCDRLRSSVAGACWAKLSEGH